MLPVLGEVVATFDFISRSSYKSYFSLISLLLSKDPFKKKTC